MGHESEAAPTVCRIGAVIGLAEEGAEEYIRLHADVWPDVLDALRNANKTLVGRGDALAADATGLGRRRLVGTDGGGVPSRLSCLWAQGGNGVLRAAAPPPDGAPENDLAQF